MKLPDNTPLHELIELIGEKLDTENLFFGHSTTNAWEEANWMCLYVTGQEIDSEEFDWDTAPAPTQLKQLQLLIDERIKSRLPFAYMIREAWFCGLKFYVDERVLVPRSYFGEWIPDRFVPWLNVANVHRALDLCTGSGCIAIALAYAFPNAEVDATELSEDALAVAKMNVAQHQLNDRLKLHHGDLFADVQGKYDLICSNPPYISNLRMDQLPGEFLHEPDMALRAGDDGLVLVDTLLQQAADYLSDKGVLIVEVGTAALALEDKYPDLAFTWLSTEDEAMALFMLEKQQLLDFRNACK